MCDILNCKRESERCQWRTGCFLREDGKGLITFILRNGKVGKKSEKRSLLFWKHTNHSSPPLTCALHIGQQRKRHLVRPVSDLCRTRRLIRDYPVLELDGDVHLHLGFRESVMITPSCFYSAPKSRLLRRDIWVWKGDHSSCTVLNQNPLSTIQGKTRRG